LKLHAAEAGGVYCPFTTYYSLFSRYKQAYLFLQPPSTITARFIIESVSRVIPLNRFWIAGRLKVSNRALFRWIGISFAKLKEQ
jgi:hypothetical protein